MQQPIGTSEANETVHSENYTSVGQILTTLPQNVVQELEVEDRFITVFQGELQEKTDLGIVHNLLHYSTNNQGEPRFEELSVKVEDITGQKFSKEIPIRGEHDPDKTKRYFITVECVHKETGLPFSVKLDFTFYLAKGYEGKLEPKVHFNFLRSNAGEITEFADLCNFFETAPPEEIERLKNEGADSAEEIRLLGNLIKIHAITKLYNEGVRNKNGGVLLMVKNPDVKGEVKKHVERALDNIKYQILKYDVHHIKLMVDGIKTELKPKSRTDKSLVPVVLIPITAEITKVKDRKGNPKRLLTIKTTIEAKVVVVGNTQQIRFLWDRRVGRENAEKLRELADWGIVDASINPAKPPLQSRFEQGKGR